MGGRCSPLQNPLGRAWATLLRFPVLLVVPVIWELVSVGLTWLIEGAALRPGPGQLAGIQFLLPPTMPAGSDLLASQSAIDRLQAGFGSVLLLLIMLILTPLVTAGYLYLLTGALDEVTPTWERFLEGLNRFGARLLGWNLLFGVLMLLGGLIAVVSGFLGILLLIGGFIAIIAYYLVPFVIVSEDLPVMEAAAQGPGWLSRNNGPLFGIAVASLLLSAALSLGLTVTGLRTLWIASPLWAFFGTWVTLAVLAVLRPSGTNNLSI